MQIETERLLLRKHRIEDYDRFWGMITDPIAKRFTGGITTLTYEQRFKPFREYCGKPFSDKGIEFAVIEKSSMMYIGYCGFRISKDIDGNEFLYGYCRDSWGKGYGFEAAHSAVTFFFDKIGIDSLAAACDRENIASIKILNRLGFKFAGQIIIDGQGAVDKYELDKHEFML
jgi:RimJ/RimL family protein N-acetyltransferase